MNTNTRAPHENIAADLVRRGLPIDYAQRAAAELADHHCDLVDELQAAGMDQSQAATEAARRLGDPRTLVRKTVCEYQRRHWCGRWPLVTFLLGPIPLLFTAWIATWIAIFCVVWPLEKWGLIVHQEYDGVISLGERMAVWAYRAWFLFAMPALAMFVVARLASRAAMEAKWVCLSAVILAAFVGLWVCEFPGDIRRLDGPAPADEFLVVFSLAIFESWAATWKWYTRDLLHLIQFLLPLVLAAVFALRAKQLSLRAQSLAVDGC